MSDLPNEFISKPLIEPMVHKTNHERFEVGENGIGWWLYEYPKGHHKKNPFTQLEQEILDYYRGVKRV